MDVTIDMLRPILPYFGTLLRAAYVTLGLSLAAIVGAMVLGMVMAFGRLNAHRIVRFMAGLYVEFLRNTPLLVLLYFIYFSLPELGLRLTPFTSALLGMSLHESAYMAEIFRAGFIAVPEGQYQAARSQGMRRWQIERHIVLPQVLRTIYAPLGNQFAMVILASSLASAISVNEIAGWMQSVGADTFRYFDVFLVAAIAYIVICQCVNMAHAFVGRLLFPAEL